MLDQIKFESVNLIVDDLLVDSSYQGNFLNKKTIGAIQRDFNWFSFDRLMINQRDNGDKYILDGRHRTEALKALSIKMAPCNMAKGLTISEEAMICKYKMANRRPLILSETVKASYYAGDNKIVEIYDTLMKKGIRMGFQTHGNDVKKANGTINAFAALLKLYDKGFYVFDSVTTALCDLWRFGDGRWQPDGLKEVAVNGLTYFLTYAKKHIDFDYTRMVNRCGGHGKSRQYTFESKANRAISRGTIQKHFALCMLKDYNYRARKPIEFYNN